MGRKNEVDEAAIAMAEQFQGDWKDTRQSKPVPVGTERLSARDARNRIMAMTPEQQVAEYRKDPDAFLRLVKERE